MRKLVYTLALMALTLGEGAIRAEGPAKAPETHAKWEKEIAAFEASARTNPPPTSGILFVGSSSIRLWKTLEKDFPGLPVINRGFGGCHMDDVGFFAERIVLPARPRQILVYAGDNDLAGGKSPERVVADFRAFRDQVRRSLPRAKVSFIAIKPSPSRWHLAEQVREANRLVAALARTEPETEFIDVFTPMLGADGRPRPDLFVEDNLHLNGAGYALWADVIRPRLK